MDIILSGKLQILTAGIAVFLVFALWVVILLNSKTWLVFKLNFFSNVEAFAVSVQNCSIKKTARARADLLRTVYREKERDQ